MEAQQLRDMEWHLQELAWHRPGSTAVSTEGTNQSTSYKICNSPASLGSRRHGCEIQFASIHSFPSDGISFLTLPSHTFESRRLSRCAMGSPAPAHICRLADLLLANWKFLLLPFPQAYTHLLLQRNWSSFHTCVRITIFDHFF